MKRFASVLLSVLAALCAVVIILFNAVELIGLNIRWYEHEYKKYDPASSVGMSWDDMIDVTKETIRYLKGSRDDYVIYSTVKGEEREVFTDLEKEHMADVRVLFDKGYFYRTLLIVIMMVLVFFVFLLEKRNTVEVIAGVNRIVIPAVLILLAACAVLAVANFQPFFIRFHETLFDNDKWWLDPDIHILINMVPEEFFIDTVIAITAAFCGMALALTAASFLCKSMLKKKRLKKAETEKASE